MANLITGLGSLFERALGVHTPSLAKPGSEMEFRIGQFDTGGLGVGTGGGGGGAPIGPVYSGPVQGPAYTGPVAGPTPGVTQTTGTTTPPYQTVSPNLAEAQAAVENFPYEELVAPAIESVSDTRGRN